MHVHVSTTGGEAKYWLEPEIELAVNFGLSTQQVCEALELIIAHRKEIQDAWNDHFQS